MGNSKNKKVSKKLKVSNKCQCGNASDQKENLPKNKVTKHDPDDSIAMSKQLSKKKSNTITKRRSTSNNESRICANGKPLPSLADLEKMFEDSDDDNQSPKTPTQKTCSAPTLEQQTPAGISENKLFSPSTISKISERMYDMLSNINPIELLDEVPPPPVIPPKKRRKTDIPYIVGCKDRPKVIRKPTTNFCKGDDDYGVEASSEDPEDQPPTKRAKKSKIPTYSKSIFNAHSDEIAERLTKDDASVDSSDSNKTIEYDPYTPFQNQRPHTFSPLPSTSRDNVTFQKNDELFNKSLTENNFTIEATPKEDENEVQITDIPYDTIIINDFKEKETPTKVQNTNNVIDTNAIEVIVPIELEDVVSNHVSIDERHDDDDCVLVQSSSESENNTNSYQPIFIDDEYSNINIDNDTFNEEIIDIIDVDDIIAENKSILDKWKNDRGKELNKISTVVDVPTTYRNCTTPQTPVTASINHNSNTTNDNYETSSQNIQNRHSPAHIHHSHTSTVHGQSNVEFTTDSTRDQINKIVDNFFKNNQNQVRNRNDLRMKANNKETSSVKSFFDAVVFALTQSQAPASNTTIIFSQPPPKNSANAINTHILEIADNRISNPIIANTIQQTNQTPPVPLSREVPRYLGDCPICMDPLSSNGIASTICGHVFCLKCIKAAIKSNGKKCPTCRKVLKGAGGGYHQLYL